jgi:hypothetical protein
MEKLQIPPDETGYTIKDGTETVATILKGGAARYRRDIKNSSSMLSAQWTTDREGYKYLRLFYRLITENCANPFLIDLMVDDYELTEHVVNFVPGSMVLESVSGFTHVVKADLEIRPQATASLQATYLELYKSFGSDITLFEDMFNTVININMARL